MGRIHFGIPMIGSSSWSGGVLYTVNMCKALHALGSERPQIFGIITPQLVGHIPANIDFLALCDSVLLLGYFSLLPISFPDGLVVHSRPSLAHATDLLDFIFPVNSGLINFIPYASWIPDFQHLHLPEYFSHQEIAIRNQSFHAIATQSRFLVVSSEDAKRDFLHFYPNSPIAIETLHFHSQVDIPAGDPWLDLCSLPEIPSRFLLCSNQFWIHKNHATLFRALGILRREGVRIHLVCTGATSDYRNVSHYASLVQLIQEEGIHDQLTLMGFIPRNQQIALIRCCLAMVQPSLFEGWSTVMEDARSLGARMIASDLAVHKEQDLPGVCYFQRQSPDDLARLLAEVVPQLQSGPHYEREANAQKMGRERMVRYGRDLVRIAHKGIEIYRSNSASAC